MGVNKGFVRASGDKLGLCDGHNRGLMGAV